MSFICFVYQGNCSIIKWLWKSFFFFYFWNNLRIFDNNFALKRWQNSVLKPFVCGVFLRGGSWENFNVRNSVSLGLIGLFKLLTWYSFNFGKWYLLRKLLISFTFSNLVHYRFLNSILMIPWISSVSVFLTPSSFMILVICISSLLLI